MTGLLLPGARGLELIVIDGGLRPGHGVGGGVEDRCGKVGRVGSVERALLLESKTEGDLLCDLLVYFLRRLHIEIGADVRIDAPDDWAARIVRSKIGERRGRQLDCRNRDWLPNSFAG